MSSDDEFTRELLRWSTKFDSGRKPRRIGQDEPATSAANASSAIMKRRGAVRRISAGAARGGKLFIATATIEGHDGLVFDSRCSTRLALAGRAQSDVREFADQLGRYLARKRISRLVLRSAPPSGPFSASGIVYKIECVLQLMPGLMVELISGQQVSAAMNKLLVRVGGFDHKLNAADQQGYEAALRVAAAHAFASIAPRLDESRRYA